MPVQLLAETVNEKVQRFRNLAAQTKRACTETAAALRAGAVSSNLLLQLYMQLIAGRDQAVAALGDAEVVDFFRERFGDQSAEFQALLQKITAAHTWISSNFPHDENGYLLKEQLQPTGIAVRQWQPADTAPLAELLDDLVAAIA